MKAEREKRWWTVRTDCGERRTYAVSRQKAIRNAVWRLASYLAAGLGAEKPENILAMAAQKLAEAPAADAGEDEDPGEWENPFIAARGASRRNRGGLLQFQGGQEACER